MKSFATELATPSVTDVRVTYVRTDTLRRLIYKDGAPFHRSKHTVAFLKENVPFIEPNIWLPKSPELNNLSHYAVWGATQQLVYRQKIQDSEHLISQDLIDGAIHQWAKHITVVIMA